MVHRSGCIGEAVVKLGMGATKLTLLSIVLSSGAAVVLIRPGLEDSTHQQNFFVDQNQFAPLSVIGNEMGFSFRVSDDLMEISSVEGDQWCKPQEGSVLLSNLDGFKLLKGDSELPLL